MITKIKSFTETIGGVSFDMIFVKGGSFTMGCDDTRDESCPDDEKPTHEVKLSDYYLGETEVTVAMFEQFVKATNYQTDAEKNTGFEGSYIWNGSRWTQKAGINWRHDVAGNPRPLSDYHHPVIHISWNDAKAFCEWLSEQTNKKYRLPTEAEWEYASRGGEKQENFRYAGSNSLDEVAWKSSNSDGKTHSVKGKKPNALGLHDMSGNVWEWCLDEYDATAYQNTPKNAENPVFANGSVLSKNKLNLTNFNTSAARVLRGGSWFNVDFILRVSVRVWDTPDVRDFNYGFRLAAES